MALKCENKRTCFTRKDGKKCLSPNAWVIFLRTNRNEFSSIREASKVYRKNFKPTLEKMIKDRTKSVSLTATQKKTLFDKTLCAHFYREMEASGKNTASNKKKVSSAMSKVLKRTSVAQTLKKMGATHTAAALAAKEQAMKKANTDVAIKEKIAEGQRRKAADIIKRAMKAHTRARRLKKEADSAKTRARGGTSSSKKRTAAKDAKRKADTLQNSAENAAKRAKTTSQAVTEAKNTAKKVAKRKIPRALAALDTSRKGGGVGKKRRKRGN